MSSGYPAQDRLPLELADFVDDAVELIVGRPLEEISHAPMPLPSIAEPDDRDMGGIMTELRRRIFERLDYAQMQLVMDASVERSYSIVGFLGELRTKQNVPEDSRDAIRQRCRVMIQSIDALTAALADFLDGRKA